MKWYLHKLHRIHQGDIKVKRGEDIETYFEWVLQIASTFPRQHVAIGALNYQDLVQAGYEGLVSAYNQLDHDRDQAQKWTYIKKRIRWAIRREIDKHGSFISRPINRQEDLRNEWDEKGLDKVLVNVFPKFFDKSMIVAGTSESYQNEQLGYLLDEILLKYIRTPKHRQIVAMCFGLDCDKQSIKEIANYFNMSEIGVKKIRERSIKKLRNEDVEKIIENFYNN